MTSINEDISTEAKVLAVDESQRVKNGNVNVDDMKMDTDNPPHTSQPQPEVVEDDDEDKYKPEGVVYLKIDNFSEFVRSANSTGGAGENPQRLSEPVYIRGLPWKILAISREMPIRAPPNRRPTGADDFSSRTLGFFLQCNGEATDLTWTCQAVAQLAIVAQREGFQDNSRKISHIYHAKENDWGYSQFAVCDTLANPENGFCVDDTIILRANVSADAPHGVHWDSKKHTGHIGLKNQGATCYMNSILQTLFFINKLRKAVYRMPTEDDDPELSVALSMQRVFYELQFSDQPVGTKKLTKSFGWDSVDSFLQHDVQELCRVLLDNLESKMKNTVVDGTIPALFAGKMKSYIKCKDVEFESSREESFYDVQLNVKGIANVTESFRDYTSPEILDGDNKYDAGDHGMQRAEKGVKFMSFPPVLTLQLMRFQYDVLVDTNTKINDRFEFPEELNLDEFIDADGIPNDYTYVLHAVLVHSGDFHGGHYVVFVNTNSNGKKHRWCKFDDDVVSRAAPRDVIYANYGGDDPDVMCCRAYSSAYMLVYVRKNVMDDVLCDVSTVDIPEHLKIRFENERKREMQRKREKEEASHFCELTILLDDDLKRHTGFDLFDARELEKNPRRTKVEKRMTASQLYETIADICQLDISGFRVWCCGDFLSNAKCSYNMKRDNYPHELIRPKYFLKNDTTEAVFNSDVGDTDQVVYVEMAKRRSPQSNALELLPLDPQTDYIAFLKFYDAERDVVEYKGSLILESGKDLASHLPQILALLELPVDTALNVLSELRPDIIFPCRMKTLVRDESRFGDGCILIAEETNKSDSERGAIAYFKNLFNNIEVEAIANQDGFGPTVSGTGEIYPPVRGHIGLDWNLKRVAEWVGKAIDYDSSRILLWKVSQHNDKPTNYVLENGMLARDLLSLTNHNCYDPRVGRLYKVYYTKMPVPVAELEQRRPTRILTVYDKFQTAEMSIFPPRNGTVQDLLNEAARDFRFSENGTKELRLVHASTTANCIRVFQIFPKESLLCEIMNRYVNSFIQLRVEEVPRDQLEIGPDEHLMPVAHFDKEPSRMFGVPFFIKVTDGEKISNVRNRIKELLEVPDREFEKYKFCIVMGARILRELDTDDQTCVVNLSEMLATHITSVAAAPYLGIDHMNKSRGARGGHATEKAIVIHN